MEGKRALKAGPRGFSTRGEFFELLKHRANLTNDVLVFSHNAGAFESAKVLGCNNGAAIHFEIVSLGGPEKRGGRQVDDVTRVSRTMFRSIARLAEGVLLAMAPRSVFQREEDWAFANPVTGRRYHQESWQKSQIKSRLRR